MWRNIKRFLSDERGLEPVEYALMLALVALVAVGGGIYLANKVSGKYVEAGDAVDEVEVGPPTSPSGG